ncbi:uncharacterized protein CIMG_13392 [Coccidioides immitis RS]|uniref:CCHC-type domain-containing protein n=1 Tax=Coccidioides immitis (strain RS) TaxID=246410 RepID=J3KEC2_COCIM|nr:uncharacterized protein CIMG_13392 [Coccidioides immitis RS]EAS33815.3 hypothetical protein CIMG_13392 [Coccidioides immitis RS]
MVSTQRSQPPEAHKSGTPAENLPEEQIQVHKKMTNLEKNVLHTKSTNSVGSACRGMKTDDSRLQTDKRSQLQRPAQKMGKDLIKNHEALRKEEKCFECGQKKHLTKDCLKKKSSK